MFRVLFLRKETRGKEMCLAGIDLGAAAVDSEALNNTAQRLVL